MSISNWFTVVNCAYRNRQMPDWMRSSERLTWSLSQSIIWYWLFFIFTLSWLILVVKFKICIFFSRSHSITVTRYHSSSYSDACANCQHIDERAWTLLKDKSLALSWQHAAKLDPIKEMCNSYTHVWPVLRNIQYPIWNSVNNWRSDNESRIFIKYMEN